MEKVNKAQIRVFSHPENIAGVKLPVFSMETDKQNDGVSLGPYDQVFIDCVNMQGTMLDCRRVVLGLACAKQNSPRR